MCKVFSREAINPSVLNSTYLITESKNHPDEEQQAYQVSIVDHTEQAEMLYFPTRRCMYMSWGVDESSAVVDDMETGLALWLTKRGLWLMEQKCDRT